MVRDPWKTAEGMHGQRQEDLRDRMQKERDSFEDPVFLKVQETADGTGRIDLAKLPKEDRQNISTWFKQQFDTIPETLKVEILEQLILEGDTNEEDAYIFAEKMSAEQKSELASFIASSMPAHMYLKTFYTCFQSVDFGERRHFMERVLRDDPEKLTYFLPFSFPGRTVPEFFENNVEVCDRVLPEILDYFDRFEEEQYAKNVFTSLGVQINTNLEMYAPYYPDFVEAGILSEKELKDLLKRTYSYNRINFATQEEMNRLEELEEVSDYRSMSEHLERARIKSDVLKRRSARFLKSFERMKSYLEDEKGFLKNLIFDDVAIFAQPELLGYSRREIVKFLRYLEQEEVSPFVLDDGSDVLELLRFNREHEEGDGLDLEAVVTAHFLKHIKEYQFEHSDLRSFMDFADKALPEFSYENQRRLQEAITRIAPGLWLINPSEAQRRGVRISSILKRVSQDANSFLRYYNRIVFHVRREGGQEDDIESIRAMVRNVLKSHPSLVFEKSYEMAIKDAFGKREVNNFVDEHIVSSMDSRFLYALLQSDHFERNKGRLQELVKHTGIFLEELEENEYIFNKIAKILMDNSDLTSWIKRNLHEIPVSSLVNEVWLFQAMVVKDLEIQEDVLGLLRERGDVTAIALLLKHANIVIKHSTYKNRREGGVYAGVVAKDEDNIDPASAKRFVEKYELMLLDICREVEGAVFAPGVIDVLGSESARYVLRDIEKYARKNPKLIFQVRSHLNSAIYKELIEEHQNQILYSGNSAKERMYRGLLFNQDKRDFEEFFQRSPFYCTEMSPGPLEYPSFYAGVLENIQNERFYSLYRGELERIAVKERAADKDLQPGVDINQFIPQAEFHDKVRRIKLLGQTIASEKYYELLLEYPVDDREDLLSLFEFTSFYGKNVEVAKRIKGLELIRGVDLVDVDSIRVVLREVTEDILRDIFDMPELSGTAFENFDLETLRAMQVYYQKTCESNEEMSGAFKHMLEVFAQGKFEEWRTWGESRTVPESEQGELLTSMQEEGLLPRKLTLEQYHAWTADEEMSIEEVFDLNILDVTKGIRDILRQAVADHHIKKEELPEDYASARDRHRSLVEPLQEVTKRMKALRLFFKEAKKRRRNGELVDVENEEEEFEKLKQENIEYREEYQDNIRKAEVHMYLARLSDVTTEELRRSSLIVEGKEVAFNKVFKAIEDAFPQVDHPNFFQDIQRLRQFLSETRAQVLGESSISKKAIRITDRVDIKTHLFIGKRPVPSCQSFESDSDDYNKGLLSYIVDPNVRIVQIYDQDKTIIARSVLRLLEQETGDPELFIERIYTVNPHEKIREAIIKMAQRKATALGVNLYSHEVDHVSEFEDVLIAEDAEALFSRGSRSGYIYTDAGGGLQKNGKARITGAYKIT